ncbi:putative transcription factor C2H2 family [Helianthus annuus]|uniref:RING-type E3 ubiquitin transferase n=1 Tax=Helianthus annuus TaxID=4232 RepID=A0A251RWS7_HELAN|nr:RING-H2 finger protein ATL54 [Helianthus annuus]KAF5809613.1 putative transcription factor C2H2 family [Helianthus annuus]KAJ0580590.1 putative transcription factor C2H2 family [Helianthus annuus]KAJ0588210.1 putative transcription factor C2H2 family [Helianthus annuus]KAJ0596549.1 putative transcription factor C2H2 family [Helianthus annuus]KAJ0757207.1 putative transcription factor C2H2 family [Helianthus annuus]
MINPLHQFTHLKLFQFYPHPSPLFTHTPNPPSTTTTTTTMAITHRKLLHQQDPTQNSTCSDCGPTCRYKCSYPEFYWPPQPQPIPPHTTTTTTHISPYVIIIVTLLASAFLFFSYYLIMVRCSTRFRRAPSTPISNQDNNFSNQDRGLELDHPIWYINTIGLQPSVINSITVFKYKKLDNLIDCTDCSVCLSEFQDNETLRLLPKCNHAFHIPCIDTWLNSHTNCPLCRAGILSNTLSAALSSNDHNDFSTTDGLIGSNLHTQVGNLEDDGGSSGIIFPNIENCDENDDSKTEYESVLGARRSVSMDSVAIGDVIVEVSGD